MSSRQREIVFFENESYKLVLGLFETDTFEEIPAV